MTESTEQTDSPNRRKYQWIGGATLAALAALFLPWLLTPEFESIRETRPKLSKLPDPPKIQLIETLHSAITREEIETSREKLHTLLEAPIGDGSTASFILQVGAFKNEINANALLDKLEPLDIGRVYVRKEGTLIRIYAGPYLTKESAELAQETIAQHLSLESQIEQYDVREHGRS